MNAARIKRWTEANLVLSRMRCCILQGRPQAKLNDELKPFLARKTELSVLNECILWGLRVVIPPKG